MLSFSTLFLNELVKTKQNDLSVRVLGCLILKWEKLSLEVKKTIVWQKKRNLESWLKNTRKKTIKSKSYLSFFYAKGLYSVKLSGKVPY